MLRFGTITIDICGVKLNKRKAEALVGTVENSYKMTYNQTKLGDDMIMPFLMGCTRPKVIQAESRNEKFTYNPFMQMGVYDLRTVGTYSLKNHPTILPGRHSVPDKKNEIDDQKQVK